MDDRCGIYLIVSPTNGRYIGSSKNIPKRWNRYKNYSCSRQSAILASLKKHGVENHKFCVLLNCKPEELLFWERVFGDLYLASAEFPNGLNITLPGYDDVPQIRSKEFRDRVSHIQKERFKNPEERRRIGEKSKEALNKPGMREKLSSIHKIRFEDPELRKQRSAVRKKYYADNPQAKQKTSQAVKKFLANNPEIKQKCVSALIEYRESNPTAHSERMKKRFADNPQLGKEQSNRAKEYYIRNSEARKAASEKSKLQFADPSNHHASKKIINTETGDIYSCTKVVSDLLGVSNNTFRNWVNGKSPNKTPYMLLHLYNQ